MYLWKVEYNSCDVVTWKVIVVNCFELCIFEKLNTTCKFKIMIVKCCELLWIMYLWKVEYNTYIGVKSTPLVVNCFELCIFEKLNTTGFWWLAKLTWLWIALNYVSLKSWIQQSAIRFSVNCSCELLWIMYLWKVEYNWTITNASYKMVVNCFELCIFEKLNTTIQVHSEWWFLLWIALNYVSLKSWIQLTIGNELYFNLLQEKSQQKFCIQFISPDLKNPDFFSSI